MSMTGFDPKWKDPADFIIGITKEIWEDRNIGSLNHRYHKTIPVRSPAALVHGNGGVIAATMPGRCAAPPAPAIITLNP